MEGNSLKSFENLCKIFEMRIKLDKEKDIDTPEDVLINYEKYAKKIDSFYNNNFENEIKPLITPEVTLEKEEERLKKLIKLLEGRLSKREELENKFYETTGRYIKGLQLVVSENELNENKERLEVISKYLNTKNEIQNIIESIAKLKDSLLDEEDRREEYKSKNKIMEDELCSSFIDAIGNDNYFTSINDDNIGDELVEVSNKAKETKETLDVTKESVDSLIVNGSKDDYSSYIEDAEKGYYIWKNRELLLKVYGLVVKILDDFSDIYDKREKISLLLKKRKSLMDTLDITSSDELTSFEKLLSEQINVLNCEKEVIENIANYNNRIDFKEERLKELNEDNNSIEVLSILREYGLIDTYVSDEPSSSDTSSDETFESSSDIIKEVINPYRIVEIKDYPKSLNIGLAKLKGESVREKVNKKLNPKVYEPTFEDINLKIDNDSISLGEESKIIEKKDDDVKNEIDDVVSVKETPTWEIPSNDNVSSVNIEEKSNIPIWSEIKPTIEEVKEDVVVNTDLNIEKKNDVSLNNTSFDNNQNMFWVPVSDNKLETNQFPNINIPRGNNFATGNDNFGFPSLKNE